MCGKIEIIHLNFTPVLFIFGCHLPQEFISLLAPDTPFFFFSFTLLSPSHLGDHYRYVLWEYQRPSQFNAECAQQKRNST